MNCTTYTKSNAEIEPVVLKYHEVRKNAGVETLDRFESDGCADSTVWEKEFAEDLCWGVIPYNAPLADGLVRV